MKIRGSIIWFVVIIAGLVALVLWFGNRRPAEVPMASTIETNVAPFATAAPNQRVSATVQTVMPPALTAASIGAASMPDKGQQIKEGLGSMNDVPIVFYGRLQDQFGGPVVGAEIATSIRIYNGFRSTVERSSVISDANGLFQVNGGKGESLGLWPKKAGYTLATTGTEFKYSYMYADHFTPDRNNPTVIKMWKFQGAEALVDISREYRLAYVGTPIYLDLVSGKVVPNDGDLEVVITRVTGSISQRNHGDWSIELRPVSGGIIESDYRTAQLTFEAPADGYKSSYLVEMRQDQPHWFDGIDKEFFFASRNGQVYGKFHLVFGINREPNDLLYFQFKGVANTNNSRNWEATVPQ